MRILMLDLYDILMSNNDKFISNSDPLHNIKESMTEYLAVYDEKKDEVRAEFKDKITVEVKRFYLEEIIESCDAYIKLIPLEKRQKTCFDSGKDWPELLAEWPLAILVQSIQKEAVRRLYLLGDLTYTKARIDLLRQLILDNHSSDLTKGLILDKQFWSEYRYQGKKSVILWITDTGYSYRQWFCSYSEVCESAAQAKDYQSKDITYLFGSNECKVTVKDKLLYFNNELLHTKFHYDGHQYLRKKVLYVVDRLGTIYTTPADDISGKKDPRRFHHSSFLSGRKVLCAGTIQVNHGKIKIITNISGHYKPSRKDLLKFLEILKSKYDIDLSQITVMLEDDNLPRNAERFLKTNGVCLPVDSTLLFYNNCPLILSMLNRAEFAYNAKKNSNSINLCLKESIIPRIKEMDNAKMNLSTLYHLQHKLKSMTSVIDSELYVTVISLIDEKLKELTANSEHHLGLQN